MPRQARSEGGWTLDGSSAFLCLQLYRKISDLPCFVCVEKRVQRGNYLICDNGRMKVDRNQFESIVGNLLKQKPATRDQQKIGSRKHSNAIIPSKTRSAPQSSSDKEAEKYEPFC